MKQFLERSNLSKKINGSASRGGAQSQNNWRPVSTCLNCLMAPLMRKESAAIPAMPSPGSLSCRRETLGCVGTLPCRWCTHWPLHDACAEASGCELWRMMRELRTQQVSFTFWAHDDLLLHVVLVLCHRALTPLANIHFLTWYCRDRVSSCNIYMQSNKIHKVF